MTTPVDGTQTFAVVPSPPAVPPIVGLIPAVRGTPFLVDDTGVVVDGHPNRWEGGFQYAPEQTCFTTGADDPCSPDLSTIPANPDNVAAMPSLIWAGDKCSTFGWSARDYQGRATRALLAAESKIIATELWEGTRAQASGWPNSYLAQPDADVISVDPVDPAAALDCLEFALAQCSTGAQGMIHCTRQLGSYWSGLGNTLRTVGGLILTYAGTIIVPDAGYSGTGPNGEPVTDGSQWAYATQMVTVRRSPVQVIPETFEEAIIRGTNSLAFRAERLAAATFPPCCKVACEIKLPICTTGGLS